MSQELLSAEEIALQVNKTTELRYNMSNYVEETIRKSSIFKHYVEKEVNKYFKQFLDCSDCQSVDEVLSQRYLSRRNAVVKRLVKQFAKMAAFKMKYIACKDKV